MAGATDHPSAASIPAFLMRNVRSKGFSALVGVAALRKACAASHASLDRDVSSDGEVAVAKVCSMLLIASAKA